MNLSEGKRGCIAGVWLLGLAGCARAPQPQASVPNTTSPPIIESTPQSTVEPTSDSLETITPSENDIWSRLRQADTHYYVLMRHAIAPGTGDPANFQLRDCSTQRNLSDEGRAQARRTGEAFRDNNVTVQQVLSSEWCRCLDTAELMDLGPVERFPALNSFFQDRSKGPERTEQLWEFMVNHRDHQGVTVMVTHFVNISAIAGSGVSSGGNRP